MFSATLLGLLAFVFVLATVLPIFLNFVSIRRAFHLFAKAVYATVFDCALGGVVPVQAQRKLGGVHQATAAFGVG